MPRCEVCGNDYDKPMRITLGTSTHVFDSFECAMHALAPHCERCGCRVVGHGVEIVLPDPVAAQLAELAANADEAAATLAARMVRNGVALAVRDGKVRPLKPAPIVIGRKDGGRPRWLEPYGGDHEWRQHMWGAIVALHGRYPRALCALAAWRGEIDDTGQDPREELAFQAQLADYSHTLRQEGGGVTKGMETGCATGRVGRVTDTGPIAQVVEHTTENRALTPR
jgi:hypothetical protein